MIRTKREVELTLDEFALEEVERVAGRLGVPRARIVERAVRHWLEEGSTGRLAARPPGSNSLQVAPHSVPLAVNLPTADWEAVSRAAEAQGVAPDRLIAHAVLLLLADVHSGRIAARVASSKNGMSGG